MRGTRSPNPKNDAKVASPNLLLHKNNAEIAKRSGNFPAHNQAVRNMINELEVQQFDAESQRIKEMTQISDELAELGSEIDGMNRLDIDITQAPNLTRFAQAYRGEMPNSLPLAFGKGSLEAITGLLGLMDTTDASHRFYPGAKTFAFEELFHRWATENTPPPEVEHAKKMTFHWQKEFERTGQGEWRWHHAAQRWRKLHDEWERTRKQPVKEAILSDIFGKYESLDAFRKVLDERPDKIVTDLAMIPALKHTKLGKILQRADAGNVMETLTEAKVHLNQLSRAAKSAQLDLKVRVNNYLKGGYGDAITPRDFEYVSSPLENYHAVIYRLDPPIDNYTHGFAFITDDRTYMIRADYTSEHEAAFSAEQYIYEHRNKKQERQALVQRDTGIDFRERELIDMIRNDYPDQPLRDIINMPDVEFADTLEGLLRENYQIEIPEERLYKLASEMRVLYGGERFAINDLSDITDFVDAVRLPHIYEKLSPELIETDARKYLRDSVFVDGGAERFAEWDADPSVYYRVSPYDRNPVVGDSFQGYQTLDEAIDELMDKDDLLTDPTLIIAKAEVRSEADRLYGEKGDIVTIIEPLGRAKIDFKTFFRKDLVTGKTISPEQFAEWDADEYVFYRITNPNRLHQLESLALAESPALHDVVLEELCEATDMG